MGYLQDILDRAKSGNDLCSLGLPVIVTEKWNPNLSLSLEAEDGSVPEGHEVPRGSR